MFEFLLRMFAFTSYLFVGDRTIHYCDVCVKFFYIIFLFSVGSGVLEYSYGLELILKGQLCSYRTCIIRPVMYGWELWS